MSKYPPPLGFQKRDYAMGILSAAAQAGCSGKLTQTQEGFIEDKHGGKITMYGNAQLLCSSLLSVTK